MKKCTACLTIHAFGSLLYQVWYFGEIFPFPTEESMFVYHTTSYGNGYANVLFFWTECRN